MSAAPAIEQPWVRDPDHHIREQCLASTSEGLPKCPTCRSVMPGGIGRGAAARRKALETSAGQSKASTVTPTGPDYAQRAAGEHLDKEPLW